MLKTTEYLIKLDIKNIMININSTSILIYYYTGVELHAHRPTDAVRQTAVNDLLSVSNAI